MQILYDFFYVALLLNFQHKILAQSRFTIKIRIKAI